MKETVAMRFWLVPLAALCIACLGACESSKPEPPPGDDQVPQPETQTVDEDRSPAVPPVAEQQPVALDAAAADALSELGGKVKRDAGGNVDRVDLSGTDFADADVQQLVGLTKLRQLTLHNTQIGDEGLAQLKGLVVYGRFRQGYL